MLISVIVPIYNVEKYVSRCINSLINQTYKNLEIILVDDGSPDGSPQICDDYAKIDSRIKVIHKKNGGVSDARNIGIDIAKGDYIGFVDPDDYIELNMFEKLYNLVQSNNCDIAICGHFIENDRGELIATGDTTNKHIVLNTKEALKLLLTPGNYTSYPVDKLYKKELFTDIRYPKGQIFEDADTTYKLIHKCKKVVYNSEPLYHYIKREDSITMSSFSPKMMYRLEIDKNLGEFIKNNYPELYPDVKPVWYRTNIQLLLKMQRANFEDEKMYNEMVNNIKGNLLYILTVKNIISKSDKIVATLVSISPTLFKYFIRGVMKFKKSANERYITQSKTIILSK